MVDPRLFGWLGSDAAKEAFDLLGGAPDFKLVGEAQDYSNIKVMQYLAVRNCNNGQDSESIPQTVGSCTSHGMRNALEHHTACLISLGKNYKFKTIFPPYIYGTTRVLIEGYRRRGDGALGISTAKAVEKYGVLFKDDKNCPRFSKEIEWNWSGPPGPDQEFIKLAADNLVENYALLRSADDFVKAIANGHAVTLASNQGFEMQARSDGYNYPRGYWMHQMAGIGVDTKHKDPYAIVQNSWPKNSHGQLYDFEDNHPLPLCCLRVRLDVIDKMIRQGDSYVMTGLNAFIETELSKQPFMLV